MTVYQAALFVHVAAALLFAAGLGVEWMALPKVHRSSEATEAQQWLGVLLALNSVNPTAIVLLLLSGLYMGLTAWKGQPWVGVGLAGLVMIGPIGGGLAGQRIRKLAKAIAADTGHLRAERRKELADPPAFASLHLRTFLLGGVIFLMTNKPGWIASVVALLVAVLAGFASWSLTPRGGRIRENA